MTKTNVRQKKFVKGLAQGKRPAQAYVDAGYKGRGATARVNASRMLSNANVESEMIKALREAGVDDKSIAKAHKALLTCGESPSIVRAIDLYHRLRGNYAPEKHQIQQMIFNPYAGLSAREIVKKVEAMVRALKSSNTDEKKGSRIASEASKKRRR